MIGGFETSFAERCDKVLLFPTTLESKWRLESSCCANVRHWQKHMVASHGSVTLVLLTVRIIRVRVGKKVKAVESFAVESSGASTRFFSFFFF